MVEQILGSPDNAMIGLNVSYDIKNRIRVYGQLLLDELNLGLFKKMVGGQQTRVRAGLKYLM